MKYWNTVNTSEFIQHNCRTCTAVYRHDPPTCTIHSAEYVSEHLQLNFPMFLGATSPIEAYLSHILRIREQRIEQLQLMRSLVCDLWMKA